MTIRKDLKLLEDKSLLFRTHGGATINNPYTIDRPVNEKEKLQSNEKMRIRATAAQLITDNDSIIIASGTTVLALAKNMPQKVECDGYYRFLTGCYRTEGKHADIEIMQLGGIIRKAPLL